MTTTEEQFVSDNSDFEEKSSSEKEISPPKDYQEPESIQTQAVKPESDSTHFDLPEKFKNKDGSANLSALVKSYKALEPLINEKASWTKEKETLTSQLKDLQHLNPNAVTELSKISVELYEEAIEKSTDHEKAKDLIEQFKQNPTNETIKELETLFPSDAIKDIFLKTTTIGNEINLLYEKHLKDEQNQQMETYLNDVVTKNFEVLKNPVTAEIFGQAILQFGSNLDSKWFFSKLQQLKESFYLDYQKEQSLKKESDSAILTAGKMNPKSSTESGLPLLRRNALDLSAQELDRMLDEYYSK